MWKIFKTLPKSWRNKICSPLGSNQCADDSFLDSGGDGPFCQDLSNSENCRDLKSNEVEFRDVQLTSENTIEIRCPIARYLHQCWDHRSLFRKWLKQHGKDTREWFQKPYLYEAFCVGISLLVERKYELFTNVRSKSHQWRYGTRLDETLIRAAGYRTSSLNIVSSVLPPSSDRSYVTATQSQNSAVDVGLTKVSQKPSEDVLLANLEHITAEYMSHVLNVEAKQLARSQEFIRAVQMFKAAEDLGLAEAKYNLGVCYELGLGVEHNLSKSFQYYSEAANLGHGGALYNLAVFHLEGRGVPVNEVQGVECMSKASDCGIREAITYMGIHYGQQAEFAKAVHLLEKAADLKDANGQYYLGLCYENGFGVEESTATAFEFYKKASLGGSADASYRLATYFEQGLGGLTEDKTRALELYKIAATAGHELASERLKWELSNESSSDDDSFIIFEESSGLKEQGMRHTQSLPELTIQGFDHVESVVGSSKNRTVKLDFSLIKELFKYFWEETASLKTFPVSDADGTCYLHSDHDTVNSERCPSSLNDKQSLAAT